MYVHGIQSMYGVVGVCRRGEWQRVPPVVMGGREPWPSVTCTYVPEAIDVTICLVHQYHASWPRAKTKSQYEGPEAEPSTASRAAITAASPSSPPDIARRNIKSVSVLTSFPPPRPKTCHASCRPRLARHHHRPDVRPSNLLWRQHGDALSRPADSPPPPWILHL